MTALPLSSADLRERALTPQAAALLVAVAAVLVYLNVLGNQLALDDVAIIQQNARVHQLADQAAIWLTPYWPSYGHELGLYRPFAIFAFALQWVLGGGAAWLFHATSILLHATACLLIFRLLRVLVSLPAAALAGALIFAVHPVHVEAVANAVGQADLLAACAVLSALLIAATRPNGAGVSWPRRLSICGLFLLGSLAKESTVVLPALLVAVDAAQGRVRAAGGALPYLRAIGMPVFLMVSAFALVLLLRVEVLGSLMSPSIAPGLPFLRGEDRVLVALRAIPEYFRLLLFPADLSSDYAPAVIVPVDTVTPLVILGALLLLVLAALALLTPIRPAAGLPAAWFLLTILPISNLLFPIGVVIAERLLYLPSVALAMVVAYGWRSVAARASTPIRLPAYALIAAIMVLGTRAFIRNADWKDGDAMLAALVRDHPESYRAQYALATALLEIDPIKARGYLDLAYRTWPSDPFLLSQIGRLELATPDFARAVEFLERSIQLAPFVHETQSSLAYGYLGLGRPADALHALDRAERQGADALTLLPLRALAYEQMADWNRASGAWRTAAQQAGGDTRYWKMAARTLARGGWTAAALAAVDTARHRTSPDDSSTLAALETAIRGGCYTAPKDPTAKPDAAQSCIDPIGSLSILLPGQADRQPRAQR